MGHDWGDGFDVEVCEGCPHVIDPDGDSENPLADLGAKAIGAAGLGSERCGLCGCYLKGLDKTNSPPSDCPRKDEHVG